MARELRRRLAHMHGRFGIVMVAPSGSAAIDVYAYIARCRKFVSDWGSRRLCLLPGLNAAGLPYAAPLALEFLRESRTVCLRDASVLPLAISAKYLNEQGGEWEHGSHLQPNPLGTKRGM